MSNVTHIEFAFDPRTPIQEIERRIRESGWKSFEFDLDRYWNENKIVVRRRSEKAQEKTRR